MLVNIAHSREYTCDEKSEDDKKVHLVLLKIYYALTSQKEILFQTLRGKTLEIVSHLNI